MWRIPQALSILCLTVGLTGICAAQDGLESMKLLSPEVGWAASEHRVFWTNDGGQKWKDITPPSAASGKIAAVFFLDDGTGWALISKSAEPEPFFFLASTNNAGEVWTTSRVSLPGINPDSAVLDGYGYLDFVDSAHGWMNLGVGSSSNFNFGALFETRDGGKIWSRPPRDPGIMGPVRFIDENNGWIAGGPGNGELYATHDGSRSWQQIVPERPPQIDRAAVATYDVPRFADAQHGTLPVSYEGAETIVIAAFDTADGGRSWKLSDVLSNLPNDHGGVPYPTAIIGSTLAVVSGSDKTLTLTKTTASQRKVITGTLVRPEAVSIDGLSLASDNEGWTLTPRGLLSTKDGGATWVNATPSQLKDVYETLPGGGVPAPKPKSGWQHTGAVNPSASLNPVSVHIGFDQCEAKTVAQMRTWWDHSPYYDTGIYIGGASRGCPQQPNLISSWVTQVRTQGWGLIPLWAGLQAPCACKAGTGTYPNCTLFPHRFSSTLPTAETQGAAEADSAVKAASVLGLPAEVVYLDLENYSSPSCGSAAAAFVKGWVNELHKTMPYAGVYGSSTDANYDWPDVPDDVYIAKYDNKVTIYGLAPLSDSTHWSVNRRIHQYEGSHDETWGGTKFNIDSDMEDGVVDVCSPECAGRQGLKNFTYAFETIAFSEKQDEDATDPLGINNSGVVVGDTVNPSLSINQVQGFKYQGGSFTTVVPPGAGENYAIGINNAGVIVGSYGTTTCGENSGWGFGFEDNGGSFTTIKPPFEGKCGPNVTTLTTSISDDGLLVGMCIACAGDANGYGYFLYQNGSYTNLNMAAYNSLFAPYLNGAHQFAGSITSAACSLGQPILYNDSDGSSVLFDCLSYQVPAGFNNNDSILFHGGPQGVGPILYDYVNSAYITLPVDYPGTSSLLVYERMNDKGQLIGYYDDPTNTTIALGFIATPQ